MDTKDLIKTLEVAIAEVEWEYPISYAAAFEETIDRLKRLDKAIENIDKMYKEWCDGLNSEKCCIDYCNKYSSCVGCFYGRTIEILRGVKND